MSIIMNNCQIHITGMHCRSCEILIEDELLKIPGVKKAHVNHSTGTAKIYYQKTLDQGAVEIAVEQAGYRLGKEDLPFFSKNAKEYYDLGLAFFLVVTLFLVGKTVGLFDLGSKISGDYSNLTIVFLVGLIAGVSTCMALVGGLVLGISTKFAKVHPGLSGLDKFKPHLFFNGGRIVSYFFFGALIGLVGSFLQLSISTLGILTIAVALLMVLLGGQLIGIFPILKRISFTLPKNISHRLGIKSRTGLTYSNKNSVIMGALTFFLPCGFTQAMQLYAISTGDPISGALTMGVFALGTTPGLLGVGGLTAAIKAKGGEMFYKTVGVIVILLALFNLSNGLNLLGINPDVLGMITNSRSAGNTVDSLLGDDNVQTVNMTQTTFGYKPNNFTIKKGIPVRWIINSQDGNSCASSLVSEELGVRQILKQGENIIEFTPDKVGIIRFSCSMGMYTGSFNVVSDNGQTTDNRGTINTAVAAKVPSCGGSGGCGCGAQGGGNTQNFNEQPGNTETIGDVQLIKARYSNLSDLIPNQFSLAANKPVRFEITADDNGQGCMGSIMLPGLSDKVDVFTRGKTSVFEFNPVKSGTYNITCAMGVPRGQIIIN